MATHPNLPRILSALLAHYGEAPLPEPRKPFELIVWENTGYLVADDVRARAFKALKTQVGLSPAKLLSAGPGRIAHVIHDAGMQPQHRAQKVIRCAETAIEFAGGDLEAALDALPPPKQRALLKRFPGIADPGADKLQLLCGYANVPALESNGLRVLQRLGLALDDPSYARAYKSAVAMLRDAKVNYEQAFALLRAHGRDLCKRSEPLCAMCPIRKTCPYGLRAVP